MQKFVSFPDVTWNIFGLRNIILSVEREIFCAITFKNEVVWSGFIWLREDDDEYLGLTKC
jgi:hypothetical protein